MRFPRVSRSDPAARGARLDKCDPPRMIADGLRRQADVFTDLVELKSKIGGDPSERPVPPKAAPSNGGW
jgi:hypothetical protein